MTPDNGSPLNGEGGDRVPGDRSPIKPHIASEAPVSGASADSDHPDDENRTRQAIVRKQEANRIRLLYGALALLTLYFGALNLFVLLRIQPRPFHLELESSRYSLQTPGARLSLDWTPVVSDGRAVTDPIRPIVFGGDAVLKPGQPVEVASLRRQSDDGHIAINVEFPPRATPGRHVGQLTLELPGVKPELWPSCPVIVEFTDSPLRVWFILRTWLIAALVMAGIIYFLCLVLFPAPSGTLVVRRMAAAIAPVAAGGGQRALRLVQGRASYLFPWKRSNVPLSTALNRAGAGSAAVPAGTLWFPVAGMSPVFLIGDDQPPALFRRRRSAERPVVTALRPVTDNEEMTPGREFLYMDPISQTWVSFTWVPHTDAEALNSKFT